MNYLNRATLIGNVTRDPEVRTTTQGTNVATFSVATNLRWVGANGERQDKTEYHNVVTWRKLAEICAQYVKKGSKIYIEGRLQTRSWDDAQGQKHWRTEIVADNVILLDRPSTSNNNTPIEEPMEQPSQASEENQINVEDIPF